MGYAELLAVHRDGEFIFKAKKKYKTVQQMFSSDASRTGGTFRDSFGPISGE